MRLTPVPAALLVAAPVLAACGSSSADHHVTTDTTVTQTVTAVKVVNGVGGITVHAGTSSRILVHRVVDYRSDTPPQPGQAIQDGTLVLTANCSNCGITYDLTVPPSIGVTINDSVGTVSVDGLAGPITVTAASGHVQGTRLRAATVSVQASAGAIDLSFSTMPTQVTARSRAGAISVEVPGAPYAIDATVNVGAVHINVANDPTAPHRLALTTNVGTITVNAALVAVAVVASRSPDHR